MLYEPGTSDHGLPYDPFKSCVVPRPIGWLSTLDRNGVNNLAPFSQFQNVSYDPPYVMVAMSEHDPDRRKDTALNIEQGRDFVWNMATYDLRQAVAASSKPVPRDVDEFELAGVTKASSLRVKPARVAESPVHFECVWHTTLRLPVNEAQGAIDLIVGRVIVIHINDDYLDENGCLNVLKARPLARLGYLDYTSVESVFRMNTKTLSSS